MKRWKITAAKPTPTTCENCEEGRLIVCHLSCNTAMLIRMRKRSHLYNSNSELVGHASEYTFIRYLDPDPETPKQVRFADVGDGVVFSNDCEDVLFWKTPFGVWYSYTDTGEVAMWDGDTFNPDDTVTLTGQVAELVEEE